MRILFVMDSLFTGGAEFSTLALASWLKQQGWTLRIVCLKVMTPSYDPSKFNLADNVVTLKESSMIGRIRAVKKHVTEFDPDVVHSVLLGAALVSRFVRPMKRKPVYVESLVSRTYDPVRFADPHVNGTALRAYQFWDTLSQRFGTDFFHAVTQDIALHFQQKTKTPLARITVVPRARNENPHLEGRNEIRADLGVSPDTILLLVVGRHEYQKGLHFLMESYAQFLKKFHGPVVLMNAGREGMETGRLKKVIADHHLEEKVLLLGHRDDVPRLLAAADIFLLTSVFEGIGGVLIEAEAAHLPIISSDLEGLKEVVEEHVNALMFPYGNRDKLVEVLTKLASDPGLRRQMGGESYRIFTDKFKPERVYRRMMEFYQRVAPAR